MRGEVMRAEEQLLQAVRGGLRPAESAFDAVVCAFAIRGEHAKAEERTASPKKTVAAKCGWWRQGWGQGPKKGPARPLRCARKRRPFSVGDARDFSNRAVRSHPAPSHACSGYLSLSLYIYIYIFYIYIYIYIYTSLSLSLYIYIYIYNYDMPEEWLGRALEGAMVPSEA